VSPHDAVAVKRHAGKQPASDVFVAVQAVDVAALGVGVGAGESAEGDVQIAMAVVDQARLGVGGEALMPFVDAEER
jgi:hypothetical protein